MGNSSYFRFDDDNKTKYVYSLNHHKEMGKLKTHSPTYCIMDKWENIHVRLGPGPREDESYLEMWGKYIMSWNLVASCNIPWNKSLFEMATLSQFSHFLISAGRGCCRSLNVLSTRGTRSFFYPRPVLAFRYCRCLRLSPSVSQPLDCLHDKLWSI